VNWRTTILSTLLAWWSVGLALCGDAVAEDGVRGTSPKEHQVIFATFAESAPQLEHIVALAKSIRKFAGAYRTALIWLYMPDELSKTTDKTVLDELSSLNVDVRISTAPEESLGYFYSRKVFAAAKAEADAQGKTAILVWMDDDTVVLKEPGEFLLADSISFGYRPVMHKLIGSLYAEPPDSDWARVYSLLSVPDAAVFPMTTVADRKTIRPYFNAGMLVVRPERGILRKWAETYAILYQDSVFINKAAQDQRWRIFLHQVALTGAVLNMLKPSEMTELSGQYNYPIFFNAMFGGATQEFDNIDSVVTLRHEAYFRKPDPEWRTKLKGAPEVVTWLGENLQKK
jgi:hypothetical protein